MRRSPFRHGLSEPAESRKHARIKPAVRQHLPVKIVSAEDLWGGSRRRESALRSCKIGRIRPQKPNLVISVTGVGRKTWDPIWN
jgi:hypothetical protein